MLVMLSALFLLSAPTTAQAVKDTVLPNSYHLKSQENGVQYREDLAAKFFARDNREKKQKDSVSSLFNIKSDKVIDFIHQHLVTAKNGLMGEKLAKRARIMTGNTSPLSSGLNRGVDVDHAKIAGTSIEWDKFSFGAGYTWDEENPALIDDFDEGFVIGGSYHFSPAINLQMSVISTGQSLAGYKFGGDRQDNIMMGLNYSITDKTGLSTILRYRSYNDNSGNEESVVLTFGTRIEF